MNKTATLTAITLLLCLAFISSSYAQASYPNLFYNNGDQVYIQSGAILHVQGDIVNQNVAGQTNTIINNGLINVEGDFNNAASSLFKTDAVGERTVRFIGSQAVTGAVSGSTTVGEQNILGSLSTAGSSSLYNIVIDREAAGQIVRLGTNVLIEGSMVWNAATTASTYIPANYSSTIGNTSLMQVRGAARSGNGIINMYTGTTDYELYLYNADPTALAGYSAISAFSHTVNPSPLTGAANDGYISFRGVDGITVGFARQVDRSGIYIFPLGSPNRTYNPVKLYFSSAPTSPIKLSSKFTESSLETTTPSFSNSFDQSHSVAPANTMDLSRNPINYTATPGFNIFQHSACSNDSTGQWLALDKLLKSHGYWSFNASPALSGTTYVVEAYPHGYSEWVTNGSDPIKRVLRTGAVGFSGVPSVTNYQTELESSIAPNYGDLLQYSYFKDHMTVATCNDGNGITGGRYSSFSHFAIGTGFNNSGTSLPVKLIDITATAIDNSYIRIDWATASEIDNKGFAIMRSDDGTNFTQIGWMDGHGTTNEQINYTYDDKTAMSGVNYYYKLNQMDIDGHTDESPLVTAEITDGPSMSVSELSPNPTSGPARITISVTDAVPATIKFFDILGKEVASYDYSLTYGTNMLTLQTDKLAHATYIVDIQVASKTFSKKLVVLK